MSWLFGSSKKKDPPPVTVDPTPIDGFLLVQNPPQPGSTQPLYPNLNVSGYPSTPSSLPYSPAPNIPNSTPSSASSGITSTRRLAANEVHNQLESVPFKISSQLSSGLDSSFNSNINLNDFIDKLNKLKQCLRNGDFDYDFKSERSILREAKMVNGNSLY